MKSVFTLDRDEALLHIEALSLYRLLCWVFQRAISHELLQCYIIFDKHAMWPHRKNPARYYMKT